MNRPEPRDDADDTGSAADTLRMSSPGPVDFFIDPRDGRTVRNAPFRYAEVSGDFSLSARVRPEFVATYDAGALFAWLDADHWAKLAFEFTDMGFPAVVSVITDGVSDDANGQRVDEPAVEFKLSRTENLWGLHWRTTGEWLMKRYFRLGEPGQTARIGLMVQSPTGTGTSAVFSDISVADPPQDMRSGI